MYRISRIRGRLIGVRIDFDNKEDVEDMLELVEIATPVLIVDNIEDVEDFGMDSKEVEIISHKHDS